MAFTTAANIPWTRIKALSFDIYGTLIDWENGIANAARATALGSYLPKDHKELMLAIEKHDTTVQREHPTMRQSDVIAEGLRRYAKELGVVESGKLSQSQVDEAAKEYSGKIGEYPAFPDTVAAIQQLGKRYKLIPLSNVDHASFDQTLAGPLKGCHFDAVYTAEDIGSYKPDPKNFQYLLEHLKKDFDVEQAELVHVAQSLFHDHGPASKVHLQSVWVDRKGFMGGDVPDNPQDVYAYQLKVESLGELAKIVEAAFGGS
jgi:2-haloalkanoic acid dehalogenase type II